MSNRRHIEIGKRVKEVRQAAQLNQSEFAKALNMTQSNLSLIELGKAGISADTVEVLSEVYRVDANWLFLGEGSYYAPQQRKRYSLFDGSDASLDVLDFSLDIKPKNVNLIDENVNLIGKNGGQTYSEAVCNAGGAVPSDLLNETSPIKVPGLPDGAVVIKVSGLSMAPTILDQDYIACMPVKERSAVRYGEIHLLITTQSMLYAKRLYAHEEGFQLTSDNRNYPVIHLKESEVAQIYDVVGRITPHITTAQEFDQEERMRRIEESFEALFLQSRKS
jgi:phage repressor protein C with HTH and peptisase S24 domain